MKSSEFSCHEKLMPHELFCLAKNGALNKGHITTGPYAGWLFSGIGREINERAIYTLEGMSPYIASSKSYYSLAGVACYMGCHHDQVFYDCPQPSALYWTLHGRILGAEGFPAYHPEYIVGHHAEFHDELVGVKLAGREPFHIHVILEFRVVLFAFAMGMVELNDLPV